MYESGKVSDAVLLVRGESGRVLRVGMELELHAKFARILAMSIHRGVQSLSTGQLDQVRYYARSPALISNYSKAVAPGASVETWHKVGNPGRWEIAATTPMSAKMSKAFLFFRLEASQCLL